MYLRARWYDAQNGRFNRLDPFFGNLSDPQSLHKYAYVHGDPISNIDPSGEVSVAKVVAIAVGAGLLGAGIAAIMGSGSNSPGTAAAYGGAAGVAFALLALAGRPKLAVGVGGGLFAYGQYSAYSTGRKLNRDFSGPPKRIAILVGDLSGPIGATLSIDGVIPTAIKDGLEAEGHTVEFVISPNERQTVDAMNRNEIVVLLGHGAGELRGDYRDRRGEPFIGFNAGGTLQHRLDRVSLEGAGSPINVPSSWITANELSGQVRNPALHTIAISCRSGRYSSLSNAIGGRHFVGCNTDIGSGEATVLINYLGALLNSGDHGAAASELSGSQRLVIDP